MAVNVQFYRGTDLETGIPLTEADLDLVTFIPAGTSVIETPGTSLSFASLNDDASISWSFIAAKDSAPVADQDTDPLFSVVFGDLNQDIILSIFFTDDVPEATRASFLDGFTKEELLAYDPIFNAELAADSGGVVTGGGGGGGGKLNKVKGSNKSETLKGTKADDKIIGKGGNDKMIGKKGDDTLIGGKGNDTAKGGGGDDTFVDGRGNDKMNGGKGADFFKLNTKKGSLQGTDTIQKFNAKADTIELKVFNAGGVDKGRYDTAAEVRDLIASDPQSTLKTTKKKTIIDSDDWKLVITHAKGTNADDVLGAMDIMIL